jgi:ribulose-5-phosphate 4-epimerase/fuculose-1-phosphate aldolase
MNRHGLLDDEVTASNLAKVDVPGNELIEESSVAPAGFVIHRAVYEARPATGCIAHAPESVANSCLEDGLPEICGTSAYFYNDLVYYDYDGFSHDLGKRAHIAKCLGNKKSMVTHNYGLIIVGASVAEAFMRM